MHSVVRFVATRWIALSIFKKMGPAGDGRVKTQTADCKNGNLSEKKNIVAYFTERSIEVP